MQSPRRQTCNVERQGTSNVLSLDVHLKPAVCEFTVADADSEMSPHWCSES